MASEKKSKSVSRKKAKKLAQELPLRPPLEPKGSGEMVTENQETEQEDEDIEMGSDGAEEGLGLTMGEEGTVEEALPGPEIPKTPSALTISKFRIFTSAQISKMAGVILAEWVTEAPKGANKFDLLKEHSIPVSEHSSAKKCLIQEIQRVQQIDPPDLFYVNFVERTEDAIHESVRKKMAKMESRKATHQSAQSANTPSTTASTPPTPRNKANEPPRKRPSTSKEKFDNRQDAKLKAAIDKAKRPENSQTAKSTSTEAPCRQLWIPKRVGNKTIKVDEATIVKALQDCERYLVRKNNLEAFSFGNPDIDNSRSRGIMLTFSDPDLAKRILGMKPKLIINDHKLTWTTYRGGGTLHYALTNIGNYGENEVAEALIRTYGKKQLALRKIYHGGYFLKAYWVSFASAPDDLIRKIPIGEICQDSKGNFKKSQAYAFLGPKEEGTPCRFCATTHEDVCLSCVLVRGTNLLE